MVFELYAPVNHERVNTILNNSPDTARRLIQAEVDRRISNKDGLGFIDCVGQLLCEKQINQKHYREIIHGRVLSPGEKLEGKTFRIVNPETGGGLVYSECDDKDILFLDPSDEERERAPVALPEVIERIEFLEGVLNEFKERELAKEFEVVLRKVSEIHGEQQAEHVRDNISFDHDQMDGSKEISHMVYQTVHSTVRSGEIKS